MALLFGPSRRDQVQLLSTLQSLHPTSVAGLAAALSWSERKTERVVREVSSTQGSPVTFDMTRRTVSIRHPAAAPVPIDRSGAVAARPSPAPIVRTVPPTPAVVAPPPLPKSFGGGSRCPTCRVPLLPTDSGEAAVCPKCGELSTRRARAAPGPAHDLSEAASVSNGGTAELRGTDGGGDRRSQELFAAWVTSRPIPCPRCRTALQHRGIGEYACPACGHQVTFETTVARPLAPSPAPATARAPTN